MGARTYPRFPPVIVTVVAVAVYFVVVSIMLIFVIHDRDAPSTSFPEKRAERILRVDL